MSQRIYSLAYLSSYRCTPAQAIGIAAQTGYHFVGLRLWPNATGAPQQQLLGQPEALRETLAAQRDTGVGVFDLEFIPWTAVKDAKSALLIVQGAGMPANAGILVDALHFGRSTTTLEDNRAISRELLHFAQNGDAQAGLNFSTEQMIHTARCERLLPGDGNIDLPGLFAALPADLPVSVEVVNFGCEANISAEAWAAECLAKSRPLLQA